MYSSEQTSRRNARSLSLFPALSLSPSQVDKASKRDRFRQWQITPGHVPSTPHQRRIRTGDAIAACLVKPLFWVMMQVEGQIKHEGKRNDCDTIHEHAQLSASGKSRRARAKLSAQIVLLCDIFGPAFTNSRTHEMTHTTTTYVCLCRRTQCRPRLYFWHSRHHRRRL